MNLKICGLALISTGIHFVTVNKTYIALLADDSTAVPILLIVVGFILIATAFLGCGGAFLESPKLLVAVCNLVLYVLCNLMAIFSILC